MIHDVVVSLRRIVIVTNSLAEAAAGFFSMVPRTSVRPRASEVTTGASESSSFDIMMQDRTVRTEIWNGSGNTSLDNSFWNSHPCSSIFLKLASLRYLSLIHISEPRD